MNIQTNKLPDNPQIQVLKSGKTGLFTNYIFKAIPLAFDESLSYYECLCGLLDYLKNVIIPTVNNNADAVAELQTLYIELKTYVDNAINEYEKSIDNKVESLENYMNDYFNNLDVQEEINNKLDDMVKDGSLQLIIGIGIHVKYFGAIDDGITPSSDSIQNALNYCQEHNISNLYFDNGTYILDKKLDIPSNIILNGNYCTLKVSDNLDGFYGLLNLSNESNITIKDFNIDGNYDRNNYNIANALKPEILIYLANSHNINIINNDFKSCGKWCITCEMPENKPLNSNISIINNTINSRVGKNTNTPDNTGFSVDTTQIFMYANNYVVENNKINTEYLDMQTAIEFHGTNGKCENNYINGFRNGIIIEADKLIEKSDTNYIIKDNTINNCIDGIIMWEISKSNLNNVIINNNIVNVDLIRFENLYWYPTGSSGITTLTVIPTKQLKDFKNININNNIINFKTNFTKTISDYWSNINYCGIRFVSPCNLSNININNNEINNAPSIGILILGQNIDNYYPLLKNVNIKNNYINNPGCNTNIATGGNVNRTPISIYTNNANNNVIICNNTSLDNNNNCTSKLHILGYNSKKDIIEYNNIYISSNTKNDFKYNDANLSMYFNSQIGTLTLSQDTHYIKNNNIINLVSKFTVDLTNITQGYAGYINLPFESKYNVLVPIIVSGANGDNRATYALSLTANSTSALLKKINIDGSMSDILPANINSNTTEFNINIQYITI